MSNLFITYDLDGKIQLTNEYRTLIDCYHFKLIIADPIVYSDTFYTTPYPSQGTVLGTVNAINPNYGHSLIYSIPAGNSLNILSIDSNSGEISVNLSFAFYPRTLYFIARASDSVDQTKYGEALYSVVVSS